MPRKKKTPPPRKPNIKQRELLASARLSNLGINQEEMARRLGVTQPTISRIENGSLVPRPDWVERLAEMYGVPVDTFIPGCAA
jgi:transcriptional regulator with XRE-family HTH domain